jgi:hypothetical protein
MSFYVRTGNGGSDPDFLISDLGYVVLTGASWTVLSVHNGLGPIDGYGQFTADELKNSYDLYMAITDGYLEWSQDGIAQETGTFDSDVAFVKDFGNNHFDLRDGRLTIPNRQSGWVPTLAGDFFYDTDDGYLVFYDGYESKYVQLSEGGDLTSHDQLSGLLDDDHTQYLLLSGNAARNTVTGSIDLNGTLDASGGRLGLPSDTDPAANFATPAAGEIAFDSDDGYLVFYDGLSWVELTDTTSSVTDHGVLTGMLDDDHTQYALLSGNAARNVVSGTFDFTTGEIILPVDVSPPTGVDGKTSFIGGILYVYDGTRSKWLSVERQMWWAARNGNATNLYLRGPDGLASSSTGYRAMRNGTIVGLVAQTDSAHTWTLEVRKNGVVTPIASLTLTAVAGSSTTSTNVDISAGDEIQLYCNGTAVPQPLAAVEIAWRV